MSAELTTEETRRIDEAVEEIARKGTEKLFSSLIAEETKVAPKKVVQRLLDLATEGKILVTYEVDCPNCDRTVGRSHNKSDLTKVDKCPYCGNNVEIDEEQIWICFRLKNSRNNNEQLSQTNSPATKTLN